MNRPLHLAAEESTEGLHPPTVDELRRRGTTSVPIAGTFLGLGRAAAYAAAKRGEIPTLTFGSRLVVPVPKLLELLGYPP